MKNHSKRIRRGRGDSRKYYENKSSRFVILGNNIAGLNGKLDSLKRILEVFQPGVVMLQETKTRKPSTLKLKELIIFEKIRENNEGGGLMTIVHENMQPIQIPTEHSEFLEVDIFGTFGCIRTINCYGPQENLSIDARTEFFVELESRIICAKENQKLICIQFDANSKLGQNVIPGSPHDISSNGKILIEVLNRQDLIIVNSTEKCSGVITRIKNTARGQEESAIDFFVVCRQLFEKVIKMTIDEDRKFVLTRFYKSKTITTKVESDHNLLIMELDFKWNQKVKMDRKEVYILRDLDSQKEFTENTSKNKKFVEVLEKNNIKNGGAKWLKELKHTIAKTFKKVRIVKGKEKPCKELSNLFKERENLKQNIKMIMKTKKCLNDHVETKHTFNELKEKLDMVEESIAEFQAEKNYKIIKEHVEHLVDNTDNLNCGKMWKLKKKIEDKKKEVPVAKINKSGKLVTNSIELKELYKDTYMKRMEHRTMKPELLNMYDLKMNLYELRIEVSKHQKSKDWSKEELLKVLKRLKKNKSADSEGIIYELFRPEVIGENLLSSLLMLCNKVKSEMAIPDFITNTNITSIYKNKGNRNDLENDRGIFGVTKVRSIIEKLIYNEVYDQIDKAMSDSNVGARQKRNIRDNLFVLYSIINEAIRLKLDIDVQFYDLAKCFDTMWSEETMNDFYDVGVKDETFALISLMNEKCNVKVKTPVGETEKFQLSRIEMQGTVPAPLKCAAQIDTLGRYCYTFNTGCYLYRNACNVPPLGMIDDLAAVSQCNSNSIVLNSIINAKIETKKLEFNSKKCFNMHIGRNKNKCENLKIHEKQMLSTDKQKYLGDMICSSGNNNANIKDRRNTGFSAISQIKAMISEISLGKFCIEIGLIMRDSIFLSKMLLNSEVWHSLTKCQIEDLEKVDRVLLRHILNAHSKTAIEWLYVDTGRLDLKHLIQIRRMMYLWHILSRNKNELIYRIYQTQKIGSSMGDWVRMIEADKKELNIDMTDEEIQGVPKETFKTFVKKKAKINFIKHLNTLKAQHSKSKFLECTDIKTAEYLTSNSLTTRKKQLLFRLRSRTLDVKKNFGGNPEDTLCISCGLFEETQSHLLQCPPLVKNLNYLREEKSKIYENMIYGDIAQQIKIVNIYSDIIHEREKLMSQRRREDPPHSEGPVHPPNTMEVVQHTSNI